MIGGEREKFSSVLLQKLEQFVKLMFAKCLERDIAQNLLNSIWFCTTHKNMPSFVLHVCDPPPLAHVYPSRKITTHLD